MTLAYGFQGIFGYVASGLSGVHRDPTKWVALKEAPVITPEITQIDSRIFSPGAHHQSMERLQGMFNYSGSFIMVLHPEEGIEFLKGLFGSVTSAELTGAGSGIYQHSLIGTNALPLSEGFSLLIHKDLKTKYVSGAFVTSVEIGSEVNGEVLATVNFIARKCETASAGTSGTSQGQNALSFNVVIAENTNDDFKLAIDGGTAYQCTIAAGTYTTAASLQAAINAAILAQTSLNDSEGLPEVACYIDSSNKVNFYTADKGSGASVAWTAGDNDANTTLGYGTPVEAAGADALTTPTYSSVQPFCATQLTCKQDASTIYVNSFKVAIDLKLVARNVLGSKYFKEAKLDGKREILLTITKDYEDENAFDAYEANSNVDFEVNLRTNTEIVASSGVNYDADFYFKRCRINNTPEPTFNAQGTLTQEIAATSFYYDATYADGRIVLNNTMSAIPAPGNV